MSIISSKAEHVYKSNTLMQEAYIAGASRQPTNEEIRAACLTIMPYVISQPSQQVFDFLTKATGAFPARKSCGRSSRQCKERQRKNESFR